MVLPDLVLDAHVDEAVVEEVGDAVEKLEEELVDVGPVESLLTQGAQGTGQVVAGGAAFPVAGGEPAVGAPSPGRAFQQAVVEFVGLEVVFGG
jgi:hypothetical protein